MRVRNLFTRSAPWALGVVEDREAPPPPAPTVMPDGLDGQLPLAFPTTRMGTPLVNPSNALGVPDVLACVRVLSDSAASLPLITYRKTSEGRTRASGRLSELLARPAPATTQANLIGTAMAHLCLFGNAFAGKFRDSDGRVAQLALLHPDRVTVELRDGRPVYVVADGIGRQSEHGPEDIVHIRGLSTDGLISNTESQALAFVTHSLRPWLILIEQAISEDADLAPGSLYVEFLLDALLRADSKTRSEVYTAALNPVSGWMTREEVRRAENLPSEDTPDA